MLFFFTDAQYWAEEYTSINRVFLEFVPAFMFWVMTVFVPPRPAREKERPIKPSPALDRSSGGEHLSV